MAKARERLKQLTLAQTEAAELAAETREASQLPVPAGGGILQRPIRPSEAEKIDPGRATPFLDFGEFFLNQLGISSERQRLAQIETLRGINEANRTMLEATREQLALVAQRGAGGINADRLRDANSQLEHAAKLLNNPVPEMQEAGRIQIQSIADSLDAITADQKQFLDVQRDRMQGRLDSLIDLGRQEQRLNDDVIAILNARGERNGVNSELSSLEKQVLSNYLNGTQFGQNLGQEGAFGFSIPFDASEDITVGNATVLVEAVRESRALTIADQIAKENRAATESGFIFNEKDGKLFVNEITVPDLGPEIQQLRFKTPRGKPLTIQPGIPTAEEADNAVKARVQSVLGGGKALIEASRQATPFLEPVRNALTNLFELDAKATTAVIDFFKGKPKERETN